MTRASSSSSTRRSSARTKPPVAAEPASALSGVAATATAATRSRASGEQRPAADPGAPGQLVDEPLEAQDLRTEHGAAGGDLAAVALDVGRRRHDEDRLLAARERRAVAVEDDAGLLGVGGTGDEGERHPVVRFVAGRPETRDAGAGWQGRRTEGRRQPFECPRTPPGGDRRPGTRVGCRGTGHYLMVAGGPDGAVSPAAGVREPAPATAPGPARAAAAAAPGRRRTRPARGCRACSRRAPRRRACRACRR